MSQDLESKLAEKDNHAKQMEERLNVNEQQIKKLEEELNNEVDSKKQIELKLNEVEKYLLYVSLFCQCWSLLNISFVRLRMKRRVLKKRLVNMIKNKR